MKDFHSHILYGLDDGSKSLDESLELLKLASTSGINEILLTPHYIENTKYSSNNKDKIKVFNKLKREIKNAKIDIKLYLGNEVYITDNILKLIEEGEIKTLNDSKYILIEFPLMNMIRGSKYILYDLVTHGYVPVLAHPERYRIFQRHVRMLHEYLNEGVLLQCNYKSLYGEYGHDAKKTIKYLLKNDMVTFLGSDCHHEKDFKLKKLQKDLTKIIKDKDKVQDLLENNFNRVINNEEIGITCR